LVGHHSRDVGHEAAVEMWHRGSDHLQWAYEVGGHEVVQRSIVELLEGAERHHPGSVDETVKAAETVDRRIHHMASMVRLAEIELNGRGARTELGSSLLESRTVPAGEHHHTSTALELSGDEAPQHSRTAKHERASSH
jgi:hypothetical protein